MTELKSTYLKTLILALFILFVGLLDTIGQHTAGIKIGGGLTKMRWTSDSYVYTSFIEFDIKKPIVFEPNGGIY